MAWRKKQAKYINLRITILENYFEKYYEEWNNKFSNDKQYFCNLYEVLIQECQNMKNVKSDYINVAFSKKLEKDIETMKRIISTFQNLEGSE